MDFNGYNRILADSVAGSVAWNVGGFGWIPTMVLSTTAVLTTNEGTPPGPIPADDGRVFALSLQY